MTTRRQIRAISDRRQAGQLERLVLSSESCRELLRAVAPTPARALTEDQRGELTRLVERRWQQQAACASADPVAWYPENRAVPPGQVFRICAACPVARSCLAVALLWDEDGIWAGTTPSQRERGVPAAARRGLRPGGGRPAAHPASTHSHPDDNAPRRSTSWSSRRCPVRKRHEQHEHHRGRDDTGDDRGGGPGLRRAGRRVRASAAASGHRPRDRAGDQRGDPLRVDPGGQVSAVCAAGQAVADAAVRRGLAPRRGSPPTRTGARARRGRPSTVSRTATTGRTSRVRRGRSVGSGPPGAARMRSSCRRCRRSTGASGGRSRLRMGRRTGRRCSSR